MRVSRFLRTLPVTLFYVHFLAITLLVSRIALALIDIPIDDSYDTALYSFPFMSAIAKGQESGELTFKWGNKFFEQSAEIYNHELAVASAALSTLAYDGGDGRNSNRFLTAALSQIGFDDIEMYNYRHFSGSKNRGDRNTVGYTFARKRILINGQEYNLIAVIVRGTENDDNAEEWLSNFNIGSGSDESEHLGFMLAAASLHDDLETYVGRLTSGVANKIYLTGHSRGAAVVNLIASRLIDNKIIGMPGNIYAYTFATPNVTTSVSAQNAAAYAGIFNIVNPEDFVPYVPLYKPAGWNYWKYGETYVLPTPRIAARVLNYEIIGMKIIFQDLTGRDYQPYPGGYSEMQNFLRDFFKLAPSIYDYKNTIYDCSYLTKGQATLKQYFEEIIVPALVKGGLIQKINVGLTYGGSFSSITYFFNTNQERLKHAHAPETYYSWMSAISPDSFIRRNELRNLVARIACPVDAEILNSEGTLVGRSFNGLPDESLFGDVSVFEYDDIKNIHISPMDASINEIPYLLLLIYGGCLGLLVIAVIIFICGKMKIRHTTSYK